LQEVRKRILRRDSLPVLDLARRSPLVTGELTETLASCEDPGEYQLLTSSIQRALRRAPPPTRRHGHRLFGKADALNRIYGGEQDLRGADLEGADLRARDLPDVDVRDAALRGANLSDQTLRGWDLRRADLGGANLRETDLRWARLRGVKLRGARYNVRTRWPKGFDPRRHGAVLAR
jgi:hypothetical protein